MTEKNNMSMISLFFPDKNPIFVGDRISIDGDVGTVEFVLKAGSEDAEDWGCEKTGGLLVITERLGRILYRVGTEGEVRKAP